MTDVRGGYPCPVPWCDHREFTQTMLDQHTRQAHPEESK